VFLAPAEYAGTERVVYTLYLRIYHRQFPKAGFIFRKKIEGFKHLLTRAIRGRPVVGWIRVWLASMKEELLVHTIWATPVNILDDQLT
jgi:hypothetical protein